MKNKKINLIVSICIVLVSIVPMILQIVGVLSLWNTFSHPVLTYFLTVLALFGVYGYVVFAVRKSAVGGLFGAILLSVFSVLVLVHYSFWWIVFVIVPVICLVTGMLGYLLRGDKTEKIALNANTDYKDYNQRKAEREAVEKNEEKKEVPTLKSFKD